MKSFPIRGFPSDDLATFLATWIPPNHKLIFFALVTAVKMAKINSDEQFVVYRIYQIRAISMSFKPPLPYRQEILKHNLSFYNLSLFCLAHFQCTDSNWITNVKTIYCNSLWSLV